MAGNPYLVPRKTVAATTASKTAAAGTHQPVDASAGPVTITLPTGASQGAHLSIEKRDTSTNAVTITGTIRGATLSLSLTYQYESLEFIADAGGSWQPTNNHLPKSVVDAKVAAVTLATLGGITPAAVDTKIAGQAVALPTAATPGAVATAGSDGKSVTFTVGPVTTNGSGTACFAITDSLGRRSWVEVGPDGAPTANSVALLKTALGWVAAFANSPQSSTAVATAVFAITDQDGRRSWLEVGPDGGPTQRTLDVLQARLNVTSVPSTFKSSYASTARPIVSGPNVVLAGHSMLAQAASAITSALSSITVTNLAVGGETSRTIAGRQGGQPILFLPNGGQIPASGPVDVALSFADMSPLTAGWPLLQGATSWVGYLQAGATQIPGTFSITRASGATAYVHSDGDTYQFTRSSAGAAVTVNRPTPFYYTAADAIRGDIAIYWAGRNNLTETDQVVGDIKAMIQRQSPLDKRFLVLSDVNSTSETNNPATANGTAINTLNDRYRREWGRRYVDLRGYLIAYGLQDAGLTATAQDNSDIAAGTIPTQLRASGDVLHLSAAGSSIVAALVKQRLQELGWY